MITLVTALCLLVGTATAAPCGPAGFGLTQKVSTQKASAQSGEETFRVMKVELVELSFQGYLTGFSFWDNTPPGTAAIARPVIHGHAGGTGTFDDPITIAVGYRLLKGSTRLDFPAGTRFYIPTIKRYAIVEDICGNGLQPHLTGCHQGKNGAPWLDIYVGGQSAGQAAADACMRRITGMTQFIIHPRKGYRVEAGALTESGCGGSVS